MARTRPLLLVAALGVLSAPGCGKHLVRTLHAPTEIETLDERSPFLKIHLADGRVYVLADWRVDPTSGTIHGTGSLLGINREEEASGAFSVDPADVVLLETNVAKDSRVNTAFAVMVGVTALVAGICAVSPKSCFGSCPTFYVPGPDGTDWLQAEGFSSSVAPSLEATDVDMLLHAHPTSRELRVRVTNEAMETHVIRHADILAVRRPPGGRIYPTDRGEYVEASGPAAPSRALAGEVRCERALARADGLERSSLADSLDLSRRETIDLHFDTVPAGDLGLVVVSRQTLLTTFLLYQTLAYMGHDAGRWLAALEAGDASVRERARGLHDVLGTIEVQARDATGAWITVGEVGETGPIAVDTELVRLPTGDAPHRELRLRLTRGMWRIDQVALVTVGEPVTPTRIPPFTLQRPGQPLTDAGPLLDPDQVLVTMPGDTVEIAYELPPDPGEHELFLEATGYYLEWMREEWLAETDPAMAARVLMDPAGAMRLLAPAFKAHEPTIEELFWGSRYVRP